MKRVQKVLIGIAAFTALGLSANHSAYAEPYGMMGPEACPYDNDMMRGPGGKGAMSRKGQADFAATATSRLDKLKTELKITADQESAWQNFAGKARQQVESMQAMRDKMPPPAARGPALSAPERMDRGIEFMKQRLASMEAMNASLKDLYAVLTPEQKAIADKHFMHHPQHRRDRSRRAR